eukprot:TRINITY_DN25480_c0_g1_i1.p1 TRINITY_DN25480_c0_g1~~TRINITY_DN25480_c0_g1_i1.p1  ORF type:complete len:117 (-),score=30.36 TRINITY_DN25480_c0_g1_i1:311-661(-)
MLTFIVCIMFFFFFQAEDGIRDAQESRGLGDVYKRQGVGTNGIATEVTVSAVRLHPSNKGETSVVPACGRMLVFGQGCLGGVAHEAQPVQVVHGRMEDTKWILRADVTYTLNPKVP